MLYDADDADDIGATDCNRSSLSWVNGLPPVVILLKCPGKDALLRIKERKKRTP